MASPAPYSRAVASSFGFTIACPQTENTRSTYLTGEYEAAGASTVFGDYLATKNIEGSTQVPFVHNAQGRGTNGAKYAFKPGDVTDYGSATDGANQGKNVISTCTTSEGATLLAAVQAGIVAYGDA